MVADTDVKTDSEPPIKVGATVVKDKASYDKLWDDGYKALASDKLEWGSTLDAHGITTMPWLMGLVEVTADIPAGETVTAVVTRDGKEVGRSAETIADASKWKAGQKRTLHWEMTYDANGDANYLNLQRGDLSGTYVISVNWTVNGQAVAGQEALTASVTYTEPEVVKFGTGTTGSIIGNTIKVTGVIDLTDEENQKMITPGTPSLPLMGEAGEAWFSTDSGFTGAAILEITNPDGRFDSLLSGTSNNADQPDTFANGVTYLIVGLKPNAESASTGCKFTLKPYASSSGDGDVLVYSYTFDFSGANIPVPPTPAVVDASPEQVAPSVSDDTIQE